MADKGNVVKKAVNAIFAAVANKKMQKLQKIMMRDPEFRASVQRLEKLRDELDNHFKKTIEKTDHYKDFDEWYEKNITPLSKDKN